ncbi:MAG: DUF3124 domain-containing protein [Acidobacteriota bacterium]
MAFAVLLFGAGLFLGSYRYRGEPMHSTASERLQPVPADPPTLTDGTIVYVPVYSSLHLGVSTRQQTVELAATVSVRNTSSLHPITVRSVRYYDSSGKHVRDYLDQPSALPPLGAVEFVIQRADAAGGPGANFLIRWDGPPNVDEPLIEAVMFGQSGSAGVSFTSRGQVVKSAPRE